MKLIQRFIFLVLFSFIFLTDGNTQNLALDSALGYKNSLIVASEMGIYEDAEKTAYIKKVGDRLVANLENPLFEYQFHIISDPVPNAFALPGGYIYITTGLILLLQSEDELACILGHEIIHSNNRHAIKQMKKSILPKIFELPGALVGIITPTLGAIISAPFKGINSVIFASYSKSSENEADKLGTELAAKAGYNPLALNPILDRLSVSLEIISGKKEKKSYLSDHPYTPKRVSKIEKHATKLEWTETPEITKDIINEFEGILVGYSPEIGVIRESQFLHPTLNFKIDFPKGWKVENTNTATGAYHKDKNGMVAITIAEKQSSPKNIGKEYLSKLGAKEKAMISTAEATKINDLDAYIIILKEKSGEETINAYIVWVKLENTIINITGLTVSKYNAMLYATIKSVAPLNQKDKISFTYKILKIVPARTDETIEQLSKRSNNALSLKITTLINAIELSDKLKKDDSIKIGKKIPYHIK